MKPTFLYIMRQFEYSNEVNSKIGISTNPRRRLQNVQRQYGCGGFSLFACWQMASRNDAFMIEAAVRNRFPRLLGYDLLSANPIEVLDVVGSLLIQTGLRAPGGAI